MKLADINTRTLSSLLALTKKKETLLAKVEEVEKKIAALASGETQAVIRVLRAKSKRRARKSAMQKTPSTRSPKGFIKEEIAKILHAAGEAGATVKEIAEKIGKPAQNIHVWFSGTGKKFGFYEKTGEGRYRLKAGAPQETRQEPPQQ